MATDPYTALTGGALIGISATLLLLYNGRIAGISGIVNGLLRPRAGETLWRALFILGIILGSAAYQWWRPGTTPIPHDIALHWIILGGLLVGFGTRMGNGCTSGHGVCGLGRLSVRSLIATLIFLCCGMVTVWCMRHMLGITL